MTITFSVFWVGYIVTLLFGLTWALWVRQDEKGSGGDYSFPDFISPLLRLCAVLILALITLLTKVAFT